LRAVLITADFKVRPAVEFVYKFANGVRFLQFPYKFRTMLFKSKNVKLKLQGFGVTATPKSTIE